MEDEDAAEFPIQRSETTTYKTPQDSFFTLDSRLSDAVIKVDNVSFFVHRNIMACCSPYFRSLFMYSNDLKQQPHPSKISHTVTSLLLPVKIRQHGNKNWISWIDERSDNALSSETCHRVQSKDLTVSDKGRNSTSPVRFPVTEVLLSNVSPSIMSNVIQFAYGNQCDVIAENVEELLLAADRFQVTPLIQQCCTFLEKELTIGNCISMVKFASHFHHCDELRNKGTRFLLNNFTEVFQKSPEFKKLSSLELAEILWSDNLNVKQEEVVLEAIVRWVSSNPETDEGLVKCIRVGLIAPENLARYVNSWLEPDSSENNNKRVTVKIMRELLSVQRQQMVEVNPVMFAPRIPRDILIVVGGSNFGFPLNVVEAFDCRKRKWLPIYPHDFAPRSYHGLVCLDSELYVVGGFNGHTYLSSCCKFQPSVMRWENVTPMNTKRCYVGVAVLQNCIYAVGGFDGVYRLRSAERFDVNRNQWSYIASMAHQRSDAGVAVLQGNLFVCGGFNGSECVRTVERYVSETNSWKPMPSMSHRRSGLGIAVFKHCMYAVGGFDGTDGAVRLSMLESYDSRTKQWTILAPMFHPRRYLSSGRLGVLLHCMSDFVDV